MQISSVCNKRTLFCGDKGLPDQGIFPATLTSAIFSIFLSHAPALLHQSECRSRWHSYVIGQDYSRLEKPPFEVAPTTLAQRLRQTQKIPAASVTYLQFQIQVCFWLNVPLSPVSTLHSPLVLYCSRICIKYSRLFTCSKGRGHDRLPKNGGMLISQQLTNWLTNHSELCESCQLNNQSRRISIMDFGLLRKVFPQFSQYTVGISYLSSAAIFRVWVFIVFSFDDKCCPCGITECFFSWEFFPLWLWT